jgi:hypothetical protein
MFFRTAGRVTIGIATVSLVGLPFCICVGAGSQPDSVSESAGLAQSPWPKMLCNAHNTGMSNGPPSKQGEPWLF